jgi:glucoamylase
VIKTDLEYVAHHWSDLSFGPWEDQSGHVLYDLLVMKKALSEGAKLATQLDDGGAATFYQSQADAIVPMLARFWDPGKGYLVDTLDCDIGPSYKIGNIDSSEILGALLGEGFSLTNDQLMATFTALENAFRSAYGINRGLSVSQGVAIGRYQGDQYDGYDLGSQGNPWPLLTTAFGIYSYRLALQFLSEQTIEVTETNLAFFAGLPGVDLALQVRAGETIGLDDARFSRIINALHEKGDAYLATVKAHAETDGSLSEQFNKDNGYQQGAPDLSMNYAAVLLAADARQKLTSWSWLTGYIR